MSFFIIEMIYLKSISISLMNKKIFNKTKYFILFFLNNLLSDPANSSVIINGCAMVAKLGVAAAWAALMTFTTETYPTVVR